MARRGKFLDLDAVNQPLGDFKLGETTYSIWPLKLRNIINLNAHESPNDNPEDLKAQLDMALDLFEEVIPDCPRQRLEELTIDQVHILMEWLQDLGNEAVEKNSLPPETAALNA